MSGGDGRGPGNTGLGHNGGKPSGNVNGSSGNGGHTGNGGRTDTINGFSVNPNNSAQVNAAHKGDAAGVFAAGGAIAITNGLPSNPANKGSGGGSGSGNGLSSGGNHNSNSGGNEKTSTPGWSADSGKAGSYVPTKKDKLIKGLIKSIDDHSTNGTGSYTIHYAGGAVATVTVPNGDVNKMNVHYDIGSGPASGNKLTRDRGLRASDVKNHVKEIIHCLC